MDSPYGPGGTTLREWILNIGITEMVLMGLGLLVVFFYKIRLSNERCFELCSYFLLILLALKVVVWAGVQCALFNYGMGNLCTGGLFAYGIVMVTIHLLFLCVTGILAYCALQRWLSSLWTLDLKIISNNITLLIIYLRYFLYFLCWYSTFFDSLSYFKRISKEIQMI